MEYYQIAMLIIALIVGYSAAKRNEPKPASLTDFDFPQADEGTPQAVIFGDVWVEDWMVLGVGNFEAIPIRG